MMSYYTLVDRCPSCFNLQKRWITNSQPDIEEEIMCVNCMSFFALDDNVVGIETDLNVFHLSNTAVF